MTAIKFKQKPESLSFDDIKENIKQIQASIMRKVNMPSYVIEYPDLESFECPFVRKQVDMHEFWEVWTAMGTDFCAVQAQMAVPIINERFSLPEKIKGEMNLIIAEINRLELMFKGNKLNTLLEAAEQRSNAVESHLPMPEKELKKPQKVGAPVESEEPESEPDYYEDDETEDEEDSDDDEPEQAEPEPEYPPKRDEPPKPPKKYKHDIPPR